MNIIVCDDTRLFGKAFNESLCDVLSDRGHTVTLFDGRDKDVPVLDCLNCAAALGERIASFKANGMVMDLQWWGDFDFGINMIRDLRDRGITEDMKVVIWSRFTHECRDILENQLGIPADQILDRLTVRIDAVADMF